MFPGKHEEKCKKKKSIVLYLFAFPSELNVNFSTTFSSGLHVVLQAGEVADVVVDILLLA